MNVLPLLEKHLFSLQQDKHLFSLQQDKHLFSLQQDKHLLSLQQDKHLLSLQQDKLLLSLQQDNARPDVAIALSEQSWASPDWHLAVTSTLTARTWRWMKWNAVPESPLRCTS